MSHRIAVDGVDDDLLAAITKAADASGVSRSQWMRDAAAERLSRAQFQELAGKRAQLGSADPFQQFVRDMSRIGGEVQAACAETLTRFEVAALESLKPVQATDTPSPSHTENSGQ